MACEGSKTGIAILRFDGEDGRSLGRLLFYDFMAIESARLSAVGAHTVEEGDKDIQSSNPT